jgi:hypothetical protein
MTEVIDVLVDTDATVQTVVVAPDSGAGPAIIETISDTYDVTIEPSVIEITEISLSVVAQELPSVVVVHDSADVVLSVVETAPDVVSVAIDSSVTTPAVVDILGGMGPAGPPGVVKVNHGSDPNVARPDAPVVYWVGTVTPTYGLPDDMLMLKEA